LLVRSLNIKKQGKFPNYTEKYDSSIEIKYQFRQFAKT